MVNLKLARDNCMRRAYAFARVGNCAWAQVWIDRAESFMPVGRRQLDYANRLLAWALTADGKKNQERGA